MNTIILFTILSLIGTCWTLYPWTPVRACGRLLSSALREVCQSGYTGKRSGHDQAISDLDQSDYDYSYDSDPNYDDLVARYAFRAKNDTFAQKMFAHYRPGVVDECCKKTCTLLELISYCPTKVPIPRYIRALNLY